MTSRWSARGPLWLGYLSLMTLFFGFGTWSVTTKLAGAVIAPGVVEVEQHRQIVQHPDGGLVDQVLVREGQPVNAGDALIVLDGADLRASADLIRSQLYDIYAHVARLTAERDGARRITLAPDLLHAGARDPTIGSLIDGQIRLFDARRTSLSQQTDELKKQRDQINSEIDGFNAQLASINAQIALTKTDLADQRGLFDRGLGQSLRVQGLQLDMAKLNGSHDALLASVAGAEAKKTELEIGLTKLTSTRREDAITQMRDLASRELDLTARLQALTLKIGRLTIRAPISGIVYGLSVTRAHSVIRPADTVLSIVPQDRPLLITARVAPVNVEEVSAGQLVRLHFSAFTGRTAPELTGRLRYLSADAFKDDHTGQSYYRAQIELSPGATAKLNGKAILPGMPVQAFIQTGEHTPLAYLLKPFREYFNLAMHDS
ncbi:MAG: HlyD family type I secretion periplasmic adaptor subunit [Paracoccaceae bacterium]|nr:HlyD family type I secretion periplasmic adaptor subunit [Paracoccaceae bacterium]